MRRFPQSPRGQALVETALLLPLVILLVLGILQLTLLQHARLLTAYAAFNAARAGVVWSGNPKRMRDAALMSLLPTTGRTDSFERLGQRFEAFSDRSGRIHVETLGPATESPGPEVDFDDKQALRLTIRVRYFFELKVPFAGWVIFVAWFAAQTATALFGPLGRETTDSSANAVRGEAGVNLPASREAGREMETLWRLAWNQQTVLLPISATHSMRMQSAFFRSWAKDVEGAWEP